MLTNETLRRLAEQRMAEARVLLDSGRWSGAYYLSGYAVELGLKAVIAEQFVADAIPDKVLVNAVYTHNLAQLVGHAGLDPELRAKKDADLQFSAYWEVVATWREDARYQEWLERDARAMIEALADPTHGVLTWIQAHW